MTNLLSLAGMKSPSIVFLLLFAKKYPVLNLTMKKTTLINPEIEAYAEKHSSWPNQRSESIVHDTTADLAYADMLSGNQVTGLLRTLISVSGAKVVAEIGMFTGFATLAMLESLPENGKLYAIEMNSRYADIALRNLEKSPSYHKLELLFGSARERINELPNGLDLVFLDADKDYYPHYYDVVMEKLNPNGLIVLDNVFWHGGVLKADKDRKSTTIDALNARIQSDNRVENVMLTVRDGITVVRKLP